MSVSLPAGQRVYAVGDIHGMHDLLITMLRLIEDDLDAQPPEGDVVEVFLGDYVDRGPHSRAVIDTLMAPPASGQRVCLMGNHEDAMLSALHDQAALMRWLSFGGDETCLSYGLDEAAVRHEPQALQTLLHTVVPPEHQAFLSGLLTHYQVGGVYFAHAGIRPGVPLGQQDRRDLLWIRDEFLSHPGPHPAHVVHGHTPVDAPDHRTWRTNIDTAAVFGGPLTAAVLENGSVRFLCAHREV
ncbi:MAG: metallophosphoesterase [Pseudomonadota bacterium]